jgi:hypothetical protein
MDARTLEQADPTFVADLMESQESVQLVADWLRGSGYRVWMPELRIRPDAAVRSAYSDHGDLLIAERVEVKRRPDLSFTCAADYPYRGGIIVDVCHSWDKASPRPLAYVILDNDASHAAIVPRHTASQWQRVRRFDRERGREREFYICPLVHVSFIRFGGER